MRALLFILALAACSPQTEAPPANETPAPALEAATAGDQASNLARMPAPNGLRAAGVDFRAVGQEPGWILDVYTSGIIKMIWAYGENYAEFPAGTPNTAQEGATRYEANAGGRSLTVTIRRAPCEDAMSGEAYPSTVEVVIDGATLSGCGRSA